MMNLPKRVAESSVDVCDLAPHMESASGDLSRIGQKNAR